MEAISIKTRAAQAGQTIKAVKAEWNKFFPGNTFDYFFLDDHFDEQYKADQRFGQVFTLFTSLAILVACLGLFGLASFTTLQRTKEIGIRKVLGASVTNILKLLFSEFAFLLVIAFVIAAPIAWFTYIKMVAGLCIPNRFALDIFCIAIYCNHCNCINNSKLSIDQSSNCKPGKEFENRIKAPLTPPKGGGSS